MKTLADAVNYYLTDYPNRRVITLESIKELGYEKTGMSLQVTAYPNGKGTAERKFAMYELERDVGGKRPPFCYLVPLDVQPQEGVIVDKLFSFFLNLAEKLD